MNEWLTSAIKFATSIEHTHTSWSENKFASFKWWIWRENERENTGYKIWKWSSVVFALNWSDMFKVNEGKSKRKSTNNKNNLMTFIFYGLIVDLIDELRIHNFHLFPKLANFVESNFSSFLIWSIDSSFPLSICRDTNEERKQAKSGSSTW